MGKVFIRNYNKKNLDKRNEYSSFLRFIWLMNVVMCCAVFVNYRWHFMQEGHLQVLNKDWASPALDMYYFLFF